MFAMHNYGLHLASNGDAAAAVKLFRAAAAKEHSAAQYQLGLCLQYGIGVDVDAAAAFHWCPQIASPGAMQHINCYRNILVIMATRQSV